VSSTGDETLRYELVVAVCNIGNVAVNCLEDCVQWSRTVVICNRWVVNCCLLYIVIFGNHRPGEKAFGIRDAEVGEEKRTGG
jgi:hypothetical protein